MIDATQRHLSFVTRHQCPSSSSMRNHTCEWTDGPMLQAMIERPHKAWPKIGAFMWSRKPATSQSHSLLYGRIMVICGMHAREIFTSEICYDWINYLLEETKRGESYSEEHLARQPAWSFLIVPQANPFGRDIVTGGLNAYKNIKMDIKNNNNNNNNNNKKKRTKEEIETCKKDMTHRGNRNAVDLNRNWPTFKVNDTDVAEWLQRVGMADDGKGNPVDINNGDVVGRRLLQNRAYKHQHLRYIAGERNASAEENPGSWPMSEPETAILARYMEDFRPDILLSLHSGTWAVMVPPDTNRSIPENYMSQLDFANYIAQTAGCRVCKITKKGQNLFLSTENCCTVGAGVASLYRSNGTMTDYAYYRQGIQYPFTLEIYRDDDLFAKEQQQEAATTTKKQDVKTCNGMNCFAFFNPIRRDIFDRIQRKWRSVVERLVSLDETAQNEIAMWLGKLRPCAPTETIASVSDPYALGSSH